MGELSYTTGGDNNLVSFRSAARVPITSLKAHFLPKQDLHGYSKPWPGGGGKNLFNVNTPIEYGAYHSSTGEFSNAQNRIITDYIPINYNITYTMKINSNSDNLAFINYNLFDENKIWLCSRTGNNDESFSGNTEHTFTININDAKYIRIVFRDYSDSTVVIDDRTLQNSQFQLEIGSTATSYESYENICPIEGWNSCEIYHEQLCNKIPDEYQRVEYLETNENNPCGSRIKTGILGNNKKIVINYTMISGKFQNQHPAMIVSTYKLTDTAIKSYSPWAAVLYERQSGNVVDSATISSYYGVVGIPKTYTVQFNSTNNYILCGGWIDNYWTKCGRYYSFTIYDGDIIVFNGVPCYRKLDNEPGLYDVITNTFFANNGTDSFTCGPNYNSTFPITFPVLGKNKFDINSLVADGITVANGVATGTGLSFYNAFYDNNTKSIPFNFPQNTQISISFKAYTDGNSSTNENYGFILQIVYTDGTRGAVNVANSTTTATRFTITSTADKDVDRVIISYGSSSSNIWHLSEFQIEYNDTATEYEPYNPDNTVYGGYVDIAKGEIVAEYIMMEKSWNEWTLHGNQTNTIRKYAEFNADVYSSSYYSYVSTLSNVVRYSYTWTSLDEPHFYVSNTRRVYMWMPVDADEFTNIQVIGHLLEPIHYPLTPIQLTTFLNQNNIWTNTNSNTEVSYAIHDSSMIRSKHQQIMAAYPHIETAASSFTTDLRAPLKSAKVYFNPVQSGTGDPSPDNVRPITGWTGLSLYHSGENLYVPNPDNKGYISSSGVINVDTTSTYTDLIPVNVGDVYSFRCTTVSVDGNTHRRIHGYNSSGTWVQQLGGGQTGANTIEDFKATVTIPSGISYIRVSFRNEDTNIRVAKEDVYEVDWEDEVGTVYGGYVDLITGKLIEQYIKRNIEDFSSISIQSHASGDIFNIRHWISDISIPGAHGYWEKGAGVYTSMSDIFHDREYSSGTIWENYGMQGVSNSSTLYIKDNTISTTEEFINKYTGHYIVYNLNKPITHTLSPQTLSALKGSNEFWANSNGNISIDYYTH